MTDLQGIDGEITRYEARLERLKIVRQAMEADPQKFEPILARTLRVWGEGAAEKELVWDWLCKPLLRFGDRMPLEMVIAGEQDELLRLINAIEHGVYL